MTKVERFRVNQAKQLRRKYFFLSLALIVGFIFHKIGYSFLLILAVPGCLAAAFYPVAVQFFERRYHRRVRRLHHSLTIKYEFWQHLRAGIVSAENEEDEAITEMSLSDFKLHVKAVFLNNGFSLGEANDASRNAVYPEIVKSQEEVKAKEPKKVCVEIEPGEWAVGTVDPTTNRISFSGKDLAGDSAEAEVKRAIIQESANAYTAEFNIQSEDMQKKIAAAKERNRRRDKRTKDLLKYKLEITETL